MNKAAHSSTTAQHRRVRRWFGLIAVLAMVFASCSSSTDVVTEPGAGSSADSSQTEPAANDDAVGDDATSDDATSDDAVGDDAAGDDATSDGAAGDNAAGDDAAGDGTADPGSTDDGTASERSEDDGAADQASGDDEMADGVSEGDTQATENVSMFADGGDFCAVALELESNDPFDDESIVLFSEEFFAIALETFDGVASIAPDEIRGDVETMATMFRQMESIAADYNYDLFDPDLGEAMTAVDTTVADTASANIDAYLERECGLDTNPVDTAEAPDAPAVPGLNAGALEAFEDLDFENLDEDDLAELNEMFLGQFDISPELQACLLENAGDLTAAAEDPSVLTQPVCGTTLMEIFLTAGS